MSNQQSGEWGHRKWGSGIAAKRRSETTSAAPRRAARARRKESASKARRKPAALALEQLERRIALHGGDNPIVSVNTVFGQFKMELLEDHAPLTVANFLNYLDRYSSSIFHRSVTGFVIQGGGFTSPSPVFASTANLTPITTDPPVQNEFDVSNLRGTVAMAKQGGDPNSATSQWFVNLGDNSANLDNQNGGFTVFGRVLGDGMNVVDAIAGLETGNFGGAFTNLPLTSDLRLALVNSVVLNGGITGVVFADADGDGLLEAGENPLAGWTVFIDANGNSQLDSGETSLVTGADGTYEFQGVDPGSQTVRLELQTGWAFTGPSSGSRSVTVVSDQVTGNQHFGVRPPPPGVPTLISDTGASATDQVTRLNNSPGNPLVFEVAGVVDGDPVDLLVDGISIGQAVAAGGRATITTNATATLADGPHSAVARRVFGGVSNSSAPLSFVIDSTAPAFSSAPPTSTRVGALYSYDASTPEEGSTGLSYALATAPAGMAVDPLTGRLTWTAVGAQTGAQAVLVQAIDLAGNVGAQPFNVLVENSAPDLDTIDSQSIDEQTTLSFAALASDPNLPADRLTFTLDAGAPVGASIDPATGRFTWTPSEADGPGAFDIRVRVTDAGGLSDTSGFRVTVREVNRSPLVVAIPTQFLSPGETLTLTLAAADPDLPSNRLTYSLEPGAPPGASIDPVTGVFTLTTSEVDAEERFTVGLRVTEEGTPGLSTVVAVDVVVTNIGLALFTPGGAASGLLPLASGAAVDTVLPLVPDLFDTVDALPLAVALRTPALVGAPNFATGPDTGVPHAYLLRSLKTDALFRPIDGESDEGMPGTRSPRSRRLESGDVKRPTETNTRAQNQAPVQIPLIAEVARLLRELEVQETLESWLSPVADVLTAAWFELGQSEVPTSYDAFDVSTEAQTSLDDAAQPAADESASTSAWLLPLAAAQVAQRSIAARDGNRSAQGRVINRALGSARRVRGRVERLER